ncbi:Hypothetical predicted protein [Paramuricea clavata]|uniref:Uncharacterized protein n=1 Tax=Paramuricea clavata TaxID=317549 RepID=A0A7D9LAH0_PARCT|nr:Hypothetical predicted protein [Paramuricea clavata]
MLITLGDWLQEQSEAHELLPTKPKPKFAGKAGVDRQQRRRDDPLPTCTPPTKRPSQVLLQVVPVTLHWPAKTVKTYAMLDLGSTCSLIQNDIANELGLDGPTEKTMLNGIQHRSSIFSKKVNFDISPSQNPNQRRTVDQARTVERLNLPKKRQDAWPHLVDLPLPPIDGNCVTVLLGADVFDLIVPLEVRTGPKAAPRAVRTALGWTATSHLPDHRLEGSDHTMKVHVTTPDEDLRLQVQKWWKMESFGCKYAEELPRAIKDKRALEILESTTKKFRRHLFGAKSSPTSANYVLRQTAKDSSDEFPAAAETVRKNSTWTISSSPKRTRTQQYRPTRTLSRSCGYS